MLEVLQWAELLGPLQGAEGGASRCGNFQARNAGDADLCCGHV